jgi:tetratricopeptide (TPR) repeat protein
VRAETRHQLKQDRFSQTTMDIAEKSVDWSVEHKGKLTVVVVIVAALVALGVGGWYYIQQQDEKASVAFSTAVRTMNTPVRPPNMPAQPEQPSFASSTERATAAHKQFQEILDKYPMTHAADFAHYFLGLTSADMGDNAAAETELQKVAAYHNAELSSLAKFALASVYRNTNRQKQAIGLYNQLIAKPTATVPKTTAQMELGATYQAANQPLEAKRIYEQIQKENASTQVAQLAGQKLQELK